MNVDDKYNPFSLLFNLFHLRKNNVFRKLKFYLIVIVVYSALVAFLDSRFFLFNWNAKLGQFHLLFSFCLTIIIAFRINTAYSRWWEARGLWGSLTNTLRILTIKLNSYIDLSQDKTLRILLLNFANALSNHLHVSKHKTDLPELQEIGINYTKNLPIYLLKQINAKIVEYRNNNQISLEQFLALEPHLTDLSNIVGGSEKILNTKLPPDFGIFARFALLFYIIIFPFGWVDSFEFFIIPILIVMIYVLLGLEIIAEEIENPFGHDENDLPINTYATNIRNSLLEIIT